MKALASACCVVILAGAVALPAAAAPRFTPSGAHGAAHGFPERRAYRHFDGAGWFGGAFYAYPTSDEPAPIPPARPHFDGAAWIVPATAPIIVAPVVPAPAPAYAEPARPGPRILYLDGGPKRTGKEPTVVYGTYE